MHKNTTTAQARRKISEVEGAPKSPLTWQSLWDVVDAPVVASDEPQSRNEQTYSNIKGMIMSGLYGPGVKLVHEDLAKTLNVSRTPVREALERLHQDGFVTRIPRRGFYVSSITKQEAHDLYDTREALEIHALSCTFAAGPIPASALEDLDSYVQRYTSLIETSSVRERVLVDVLFHLKLSALSGNRYLVRLLAQTFERITLKRRSEGYRSDRGSVAGREHREFMDVLRHNKADEAIALLQRHIREARDALVNDMSAEL